MKHAGPAALDELEPLLARLRVLPGLREKTPGVFYRGSRAFLHFHEDPSGFYADVRLDGVEFERRRATTVEEQAALVVDVTAALAAVLDERRDG